MIREHDYEPVWGLPERLPEGETVLWQGRPDRRAFARRALHLPGLAAYFGVLVLARAVSVVMAGASVEVTAMDSLWFLAPSVAVIALGLLLAWGVARSTAYTITNRRVVMRFGIALSLTVNLPFALVHSAAARLHADGSGDISLALQKPHRISYLFFWPHVRPWHLLRPQPTLRGIADAATVAQVLARALAGAAALPVQPVPVAGQAPGAGELPQPQAA
ncbi:photosynthetic complex putative assembly protein PuhB [Paracraurococcus lichenis]|uniref:Photosynthetic complex putative assembly protein PuhB n=1 Tax=Paracraurococcus lichenis TaxID=3064888 RepID=A0ABT9DU87_9PROT|nr:photosynthetic complex putative assembly protein PuhB [Paracraurococcus sp. LOR1-02]MDO9707459.1 photosynthetic complex putative assembly protein PuhB [Paracraurococcus sp. LOR1-02]